MSRYRRWNELLELLATRGQLQVEDAAKALNVSAATIRRDFDELASQQMLTRIRGGAVAEGVNYDLPLRYKTERHPSEKQRIGALAASMVRAGQVVGLNGGTTTTEVARALATRSDLGSAGPSPTLTVVTNALNIATELAIRQHIKIVTTGGVARPQSYELTGPLATGVLEQVTLDVAILGVDGIDAVAGATAHHEGEASINRLMGRQARQVIIVADSSKVGQRAFARICTPAEIDVLVTDTGIAAEDAAKALNVSAATIRRDIDELASQQLLTRIRGGAVAEGVNYDLPLRYKTERHPSEKQRIGALAASMVRTGQVAGLNGGTTTTEVARALATRSDLGSAGPSPTLTVVTNALNIATELAIRQHIKIVTTGGVARPQSYELTGPLATGVLEQVTLDVAILGVDGIDAVAGATAHHEGEASINRLMGRQARQVIIVADSSKVGQRAFARICTPAEIDVLVTDAGIAAEDAARLRDAGVDVVTA